jgi:hypothetical protein
VLLVVVGAVAAPRLVTSADADHIILLSIANVRPDMNKQQVRKSLGAPRRVKPWRSGGSTYMREWRFRDRLSVFFEVSHGRTGPVTAIRTKSPRDRFRKGIHVGVPERWVHRLGGVKCYTTSRGFRPYPRGHFCQWYPRWARNDGCLPHLVFYMPHQRGRVRYIELIGTFRASRAMTFRPSRATARLRGCA